MKTTKLLLIMIVSLVVAACGGGGGSAPNNTATISGSSTVNPNTVVVSGAQTGQIASTTGNADGSTQLVTTPNSSLGAALTVGSVVQMSGGADTRFPLGLVGKVTSVTTGSDGVTSAALTNATLADVAQKSTFQTTDVTLNSTNFVGVISPKAVQAAATAAQPQVLSVLQQGVSALNGGLVLSEPNLLGQVANKAQSGLSFLGGNGTIDVPGKINLTIPGIKLADMGLDPSRLKPYGTSGQASFDIVGSIKNLKLIENHDFDTTAGVATSLKSMDMRVTGDVDVSVNLHGGVDADLGYFSQAWKEVEDQQMSVLGVSAKLTGLDSKDKIGKYPIAGLVFAVPCPAIGCPIMSGQTQTPLRAAKAGGVIVWVYLTANGKITLDGEVGARLNAGSLNLGLQKTVGGKLVDVHELNNSGTGRLIEAPYFSGESSATLRLGTAIDVDFFTLGVRIGNASVFTGGQANATLKTTTPVSYGTTKFGDPWTWVGQACLQTSIGAGAIFSAAVDVGIEVDTLWKKVNANFSYGGTWPTEAEILIPGWHGIGDLTWYTAIASNTCPTPANINATAGDGQAIISWNTVAGVTYNLYMASVSGVTKANYTTLADGMQHVGVTSPYVHTGLANGKPYYFVVTAVNANGESIESTEISVTPMPIGSFVDNFDGTVLQSAYWTQPTASTGAITVSGGIADFACRANATTEAKQIFSGNQIIVESRMAATGNLRDTTIALVDVSNGDRIQAGDTNYGSTALGQDGLYTLGTGAFSSSQGGNGVSVNTYKEYRLTITGAVLTIERGDTLANITESRTVTLSSSIAGKTFYLLVGTGGPDYCPGSFDWIRVY